MASHNQPTQSSSTNSSFKELTINDLPLLCNTLNPVASKCFALGLQLGVEEARIRTIIANNRNDCEAQLREIISKRLQQDSPLTWHNILTILRSPTVDENSLASQIEQDFLLQPLGSRSPVRGPSDRGHYRSQLSMRGPSDRGHYRSQLQVRGPLDRGHYRSQLPVREPSDRGHYRSQLPVRGPSDRGHCRFQSPMRGPSDREHYRSQLPVREPSDRGHYRSQLPVRGPSDRGHCRFQSPVSGPSDRGHYRSQSSVRGSSDRGHYRSQSPVRGPSDRGHYRSQSPVRGPSDRGHYRSQSSVRGPSGRGHYRSQSSVRGPSGRGHYRSQSSVTGPSDRGHYRSQSSVRGPSDRGHYRSQSSVRGRSDSLHYRSPVTQLPYMEQPQYPPPPPPTHNSQYSLQMSQFIDYVKTIYRSSEVERDTKVVKWPPTPSKVFINLACIDRASVRKGDYDEITKAMVHDGNVDVILKNKRSILLNEVARDIPATNSTHRVILVEGAPGVGKSTFAWEFCRRWERGEIAQQYQLVLLLRLRDKRMSRAKSLRDLIYHPLESVSEAVSLKLVYTHGLNALIILEGYDELPESCRLDQSLFPQLLAGEVLPLATIMVTSRPWATGRISHSRIYQHIEILGFTSQQITEYMESTLPPDQVSDLSLYLERHPQIRMCMYIPLNSAIVVTVYQESQAGTVCALPTTRTELYTALARTLLLRYLCGHPEYESGTKPMKTFKDLPPVVYGKFSQLSKLAYSSIAGSSSDHVQLIFNDSDLPSDFDSLGFMDSVTELYVTQGTVSSHNFLHLTFQEFLAAVHISSMSPSAQLEHFQRHEDGRYRVVLRFLAGLTKLSCFSKDTIKNIFTCRDSSPYCITIDLVNWMFEAHSDDVISLLLERKNVCFTFNKYSMLPLDYYSVGYCIAHSQCQWMLSLNWEVGEEEVRMLMAAPTTRQETRGRVVGLRGEWDSGTDCCMVLSMSAEALNVLFTQWKSVLHLHELHLLLPVACDGITWPDLSGLQVLNLKIKSKMNWRLDNLLLQLSLESLTISCTGAGGLVFEDCVAIGKHIKSTKCLKEFYIEEVSIVRDDEVMKVISKALSDNQSLPLETLKLDCFGTFTDTAADCLAQFITNTTTLQHLKIYNFKFTPHGLLALAQALHHNSTLQEKSLKKLIVIVNGDNEANDFAKLLVEYPFMVDNLDNQYLHNISDAGAPALTRALHHNSTLKELDLSNNRLSDAGAVALAQALHHNSTLKDLCLSNNRLSDVGAVSLAQALHHNSTLKMLDLSGNDAIGKEGIHHLVQSLTVNTSLTKVTLYSGGGLILPRRCKEYATQCTQYNTVKSRLRFW